MAELSSVAVIACAPGALVERRLLGLGVGERLLLALAHRGFEGVVFVGSGPRPRSDRAALRELRPDDLDRSRDHLVIPSDAVFAPDLLRGDVPADLPVARIGGAELDPWLADPDAQLAARPTAADHGRTFAVRVRDRASAARARRALLRSLRKPIDGLVSRALNRHVSLFLSRFLVATRISPNAFTLVFMALGLASAFVVALNPAGWGLVLGAALFQGQSILDGCDGEMARLTYRFSRLGQWLDSIGDDLTNYAFCLALALGQAQHLDSPTLLWLGLATLAIQLTTTGLCYRRMLILGTGDLLAIPDLVTGSNGEGGSSRFISTLRLIFKRDTFVLIVAVLTAAQLPVLAFALFAAGTIPVFIGVTLNEYRLSKLDPA